MLESTGSTVDEWRERSAPCRFRFLPRSGPSTPSVQPSRPAPAPVRFGGSHNLLEHRGAIDLFAQCQILVSDSLFGLLAVFDVGPRRIPANDMSLFVTQRPVVDEKPTTPTVFPACPNF